MQIKTSIILFVSFIIMTVMTYSQNVSADGMPVKSGKLKDDSANKEIDKKTVRESENKLPAYSLPQSELSRYQYCGIDSDCIQVINGCCQCMQGDPFTAINKDLLAEFMKQFSCEKVTCPDDSKTYSCNDGTVSCINFKCHYFPPE